MANIIDRIRRNKKKLFIIGGITTLGYVGYKLSKYIFNYNINQESKNSINFKIQKAQYFQSMLTNCSEITETLMVNLEQDIEPRIDTEDVANNLGINSVSNGRKHSELSAALKLELWQKLKVLCFTKIVVLMFCWSYLTVAIHIQMSILAGYLFSKNGSRKSSVDLISNIQRWLFSRSCDNSLDENFQKEFINFTLKQLKQQIPRWTELVQNASVKVVGKLSLKRMMTPEDIIDNIEQIRNMVQSDIWALCLQGLHLHNSNKQLEGPMYITLMDTFQNQGLGHMDQLMGMFETSLCAVLSGKKQGDDDTESLATSRMPLAKFVPLMWSSTLAGNGGICVGDCIKQFALKSEFRLTIFKTYDSCTEL